MFLPSVRPHPAAKHGVSAGMLVFGVRRQAMLTFSFKLSGCTNSINAMSYDSLCLAVIETHIIQSLLKGFS